LVVPTRLQSRIRSEGGWNIIWQNSWIGDEIGAFIAAYGASVRQYPNVASGQPNEPPPRHGAGNVVADEGKPQHG
jgi:hypothetical protein